MEKPTVFITRIIPDEVEQYIGRYCNYKKWELPGQVPRETLLEKITDVEGLLTTGTKIDEELLSHAPRLKVVSNMSVGYDNFDIGAMKKHNIMGTNTPYVLDDTVADLIFALVLSSARRIPELDRYVKEGSWKRGHDEVLFGTDVHHSTLGIIGMGRIGEAVAKRAVLGFDMEVLYYNRSRKSEAEHRLGVKYTDLNTLLVSSDFIVLLTPLNGDTYHLIDFNEFSMMKSTAIFINASRGQTVNEAALIDALKSEKIRGAGLDVYEVEPVMADNELLKMDNVVTLPHIGSATSRTRSSMAMTAAQNMVAALVGKIPPYIVPELKPFQ